MFSLILFSILLTSLMSSCTGQQQSIITSPDDTVAPIGGTVTLSCVAVNKTGHLLWLHNDDRVISKDDRILAADDRYEIVGGDGDSDEYSLKIHNLTASDQGTYRCLLTKSDNHGQVIPDAAQLTIVYTELQTFIKTPTSITTTVGFNVTFECAVANKVGTLIWFIDSNPVSADERVVANDNRYSIVVGQSQLQYNLQIEQVVAEDSGLYQCVVTEADNNPRIESSVVRLTVNASSLQSFLVEPGNVILLEGSNHTLECSVSDKEGVVIWQKDGEPLNSDYILNSGVSSNIYEVEATTNVGVEYNLIIKSVTSEEAGTYTCTVTAAGSSSYLMSRAATVIVIQEQTISQSPTSRAGKPGDNITLQCETRHKVGYLEWYRSQDNQQSLEKISTDTDVETAFSDRYSIVGNQANGEYILEIRNLQYSDAGQYSCHLTEEGVQGQVWSSPAELTVIDSIQQSFLVEPSSASVLEDDDHTLQCSVSDKEGVVIWQKDGEPLNSDYILNSGVSGNIYQVEAPTNVGVEYNLIIKSVTSEEAGTYTCTVTAAGSSSYLVSSPAIVSVIRKQTISRSPTSRVGRPGESITLQCVTQDKVGHLEWYQSQQGNRVKISSDTSVETTFSDRYSIIGDQVNGEYILEIRNLQYSDAGQYSCHLTEEGVQEEVWSSTAELTVMITATEPPSDDSPVCQIETRNDTMYLGDTVLFTCEFQGVGSLPGLQWSKDEQPIQQMNMESPTGVKVGFQLSVSENEGGVTYTCTASHATFSEPKTCHVGPLKIEWIKTSPKSATVFPYGTVTLECQIGRKIGSVVWYKDEVAITSDTTVTNGNSRYLVTGDRTNKEYNLLINDIQAEDAGYYQCGMVKSTRRRRKRSVEGRSESAYLHVDTTTPHLYMVPADRVSREGYSVEIKCAIVNKEVNSQLLWYQDDILISTDRDVEEGYSNRFSITGNEDRGEYFLNIRPAMKNDAGVYKCQSTGSQSKSSLPVQLTLRDAKPPGLDYPACSGPSEDELQTGSNVTITCTSRGGDPMPTLVWQHDNDQLVPDFTVYGHQSVSVSLQLVLTSDLQGATFTCSSDHVTFAQPKECTIGPLNVIEEKHPDWQALVIGLSVMAFVLLVIVIVIIVMKCAKVCKCTSAKKVEEDEVTVVRVDPERIDSHSANTGDSAVLNNLDKPGKANKDTFLYSKAADTVGPQQPRTFYPHHTEGYEYNDEKSDKSAKAKRRLHNRNVVVPQNVEDTPAKAFIPTEATVAGKQGEEEIDKDDRRVDDRKVDDRETSGRFSDDDVSNGSGDVSYADSYEDKRGGRRQSDSYDDEGYRRPYSDDEDNSRRRRNSGEYDDGSHRRRYSDDYDEDSYTESYSDDDDYYSDRRRYSDEYDDRRQYSDEYDDPRRYDERRRYSDDGDRRRLYSDDDDESRRYSDDYDDESYHKRYSDSYDEDSRRTPYSDDFSDYSDRRRHDQRYSANRISDSHGHYAENDRHDQERHGRYRRDHKAHRQHSDDDRNRRPGHRSSSDRHGNRRDRGVYRSDGKGSRDYNVDRKERPTTGRRDARTDRDAGQEKHAHFEDERESNRRSGRKVAEHTDPQGERGVRDHVEVEYATVQKNKVARDAIKTSHETRPSERETLTLNRDNAKQHRGNDADVLVSKHRGDKTDSEEGEKSEHSKRSASPADDAGTSRPEATANDDIGESSHLNRGGDDDIEMKEMPSTKDDKRQSRSRKKKSKKKKKKKDKRSSSSSSSSDSSSDEEIKKKKKKKKKRESSSSSSESSSDVEDENRAKSKHKSDSEKIDASDGKRTKHRSKSRDSKDETKTRQRDGENEDKSESRDMEAEAANERMSGSGEKPKKKKRKKKHSSKSRDNDEGRADSRGESAVRETEGDDVMAARDNNDANATEGPLNDVTGGTTFSVVNETDDRDQETVVATANDGITSGSHGDKKHKKSKKKRKKKGKDLDELPEESNIDQQ
ncbi:uncharacterized protein [Ptychodera flava]|uniref:uncharacterized protein n=1 Tax=Ptychodera flava TaxID=63121 RepID=UPI00396A4ABE